MFKKFTLPINNFPMDECNCASCAFSFSEHIMDMSNICHWPQIPSIGQSVCGSVMSCFTFNSFHFSCQYMSNHYYLCNMLIVRRLGATLTQQVAEVIVGCPLNESEQTQNTISKTKKLITMLNCQRYEHGNIKKFVGCAKTNFYILINRGKANEVK